MNTFEVEQPILNSPYDEPREYWRITRGEPPERMYGRRPAMYHTKPRPMAQPRQGQLVLGEQRAVYDAEATITIELKLVNRIRERVKQWREQGYPGVTRTTLELLNYWQREGRQYRLFFAQLEAAETIIFLAEARADFKQGLDIPLDEPSADQKAAGVNAFIRQCCKMATGSGKTTVMAMLAAWSILNKVNSRNDARFSDVVFVVCPNVTIRNRLQEINPNEGDASLYRKRDLVPAHLMAQLRQGFVLVTNWHVFELQTIQQGDVSARVVKAGVPVQTQETITISDKTTTARGIRYLTLEDYQRQVNAGMLTVLSEDRDKDGNLRKARVESLRYVESDTAWIERVLGRDVGGKQHILVINDEAHHAYRLRSGREKDLDLLEQADLFEDEEDEDEFEQEVKEATIWVEGLDRIHKLRGINLCVDFSATPYYLNRTGNDANRIFPWVVSDFSLTDAIESGLVKIPQFAVRDPSGAEIPGYFNVWRWLLPKLSPAERGGKKASPKPEAVLKWSYTPIEMLAGLWKEELDRWQANGEPRPPVFILVCKNTKIAKVIYEWLAENAPPTGIPHNKIEGLANTPSETRTIRVDSKVVHETDTGESKSDENAWMRFMLDTVGKTDWPLDAEQRPIYPPDFEALAEKLGRPKHPPGRDVRCIVSVGMLTEGWDCNTVTHIIGLRPFMSQLLCEQVVGRGLRRASYDVDENGLMQEEVAKVFGVPFEIVPFKENKGAAKVSVPKRNHVHAIPGKERYKIEFPRVEGYKQALRGPITVNWGTLPSLSLDPTHIPPEVEMKAAVDVNTGRPSLMGPGKLESVTLNPFRKGRRVQELAFTLAGDITRHLQVQGNKLPTHALFPQALDIVSRYLQEKVKPLYPAQVIDAFCAPYYGWIYENLLEAIQPDLSKPDNAPEVPRYESNRTVGSTSDVDYWTTKRVFEVEKSHVNFVVADTKKWEQSAAYVIDTHPFVDAFVKNAGLGFAIPYLHDGQMHDYLPDFIVRLKSDPMLHLILETKGFDFLAEKKLQAAERWINAVNADGKYGVWAYDMVKLSGVAQAIERATSSVKAIEYA